MARRNHGDYVYTLKQAPALLAIMNMNLLIC